MKIRNLSKLNTKKLIVFDLDGTLVETKSPVENEMLTLFKQLLEVRKVAIIGGGKYEIFQDLLLKHLGRSKKLLDNLFLFPTTATSFYRYQRGWKRIYLHTLSKHERNIIKKTFQRVFDEIGYRQPRKVYGQVIEDRKTQITFSALGQDVVEMLGKRGIRLKEKWKQEHTETKLNIAKLMAKYLPNLEVHAAGFTSIDITKKGIDKAYGVQQIEKHVGVKIKDMVFIGDALFPGGNDYAAIRTGIDYIPVANTDETKKIIHHIVSDK